MKLVALVSCAVACAALSASATAKAPPKPTYLTPPGNSGITQYSEVVPSSNGNSPTGGLPSSPSTHLPPGAAHALAGPGKARQELSRFVAATAPPSTAGPAGQGSRSRRGSAARHAVSAASAQSGGGASGLTSIARALVGDGGGMGFVLPLILGAALATAVFVGLRRRAKF